MPNGTLDLVNAVDKYLNKRTEMVAEDMELIIKLRDFIIKQNKFLDGLIADRERQLLQRKE